MTDVTAALQKPAPLFAPTPPNRVFARSNKLLYGFPKTGKTTLMSYFRDEQGRPPLFIMSEDGKGELPISVARVRTWDKFIQLIAYLEQNRSQIEAEHSCLILDIAGDLDDWCANHICSQANVSALADLSFGKGPAMHKRLFQEAIYRLLAILPVSFIAHAAEREFTWNGEKIKMQAPSLQKNALEFVNGKVDTIMFLAPASSKREYPEIIVQNSHTCVAGSRYPQLIGSYTYRKDDPGATAREMEIAFNKGPAPTAPVTAMVAETDTPATPTP